jgi:hypothetical protein
VSLVYKLEIDVRKVCSSRVRRRKGVDNATYCDRRTLLWLGSSKRNEKTKSGGAQSFMKSTPLDGTKP